MFVSGPTHFSSPAPVVVWSRGKSFTFYSLWFLCCTHNWWSIHTVSGYSLLTKLAKHDISRNANAKSSKWGAVKQWVMSWWLRPSLNTVCFSYITPSLQESVRGFKDVRYFSLMVMSEVFLFTFPASFTSCLFADADGSAAGPCVPSLSG